MSPKRAGHAAAHRGAVRLGAVLDDDQARGARRSPSARSMSTGWPKRCTGMIALVRGVISASTRSRSRFQVSASESTGTGTRAVVVRGQRGRDVGAGADQHLVARADAGRRDRELQRGGAARHRHAVLRADVVGELALEARGSPRRTSPRSRRGARPRRPPRSPPRRCRARRPGSSRVTSTSTLSSSSPRNGPCLTLSACMSSITRIAWTPWIEHDRVARPQPDLAQQLAVVGVELHVDDAALHDEHLLQVVDLALERPCGSAASSR